MGRSAEYLEILTNFLNKTTEISDQLLMHLDDTNYKTMDVFKVYIGPQRNIECLLGFYGLYTDASREFGRIKIAVERAGWEELAGRGGLRIDDLERMEIVAKIEGLRRAAGSLREYGGVKIVQALAKDIDGYVGGLLRGVRRAFFCALDSLPKVPDGAARYAQFLLGAGDSREFLGQYTKKVYNRLGFFEASNSFDALLQQTDNITSYLGFIIEVNRSILGKEASHNINVGLITLIVVNLKKIISDALGAVNKDNRPGHLPFLIRLCGNLRHSKGAVIREIEELFVFRAAIHKLILNCFVQFFGELELLDHPRGDCGTEELNREMVGALRSFSESKEVRRGWVETHGPSFGVYAVKELGNNFGEKCLIKTKRLSEQLGGMEKYIYLINNLQAFGGHTLVFEGQDLKVQIDRDCQILIGLWRIGIEAVEESRLGRFLRKELRRHGRYRLPEEQRRVVSDALKKIVEGLVASTGFVSNVSDLVDALNRVYAGDE